MTALEPMLTAAERVFIGAARRGVLGTVKPNGLPRLVPICFVLGDEPDEDGRALLYSPLDEKPKSVADPYRLARVADIVANAAVEVLVDRWSEDWSALGWIRLTGGAALIEPDLSDIDEHQGAVVALRQKYSQYADHLLEGRPIIRIAIARVARWGNVSA
ncbi:MAG TPA: TIGR03668 family PPOX class F420-dependent oxidoreductase [Candidatus Eisenbacteria bacterium]|nr:TIGR03668 family PPOX class F420-dependent oxidoreductase [Candidatus Eisenbacteria bacterium]